MNAAELGGWAFGAICVIGAATGLLAALVLRAFSNQAAIARAKNLIVARLLEFRLFGDEPLLVLRAQGAVVLESLRLIKLLLLPAAILTVPMLPLFAQLDAVFGQAPLGAGEAGVVTVAWRGGGEAPKLEASEGIAVEGPPVRIAGLRQVSWRVRPSRDGAGVLRLIGGGQVWTKAMPDAGFAWPALSVRDVEWIEIPHRPAAIFGWHWLVWFLTASGVTILLLRKRLGVAL